MCFCHPTFVADTLSCPSYMLFLRVLFLIGNVYRDIEARVCFDNCRSKNGQMKLKIFPIRKRTFSQLQSNLHSAHFLQYFTSVREYVVVHRLCVCIITIEVSCDVGIDQPVC